MDKLIEAAVKKRLDELAEIFLEAAKPPLGSGERFKALTKKGVSPALAAYIGRKKYGKKKFAKLSAKEKKKAVA